MKKQLLVLVVFLILIWSKSYAQGEIRQAELPAGFLPFEEFEKEFQLGGTSTEQLNAITKTLSQTMHRSIPEGLELLLQVDESVIAGLESFIPFIESHAPSLAYRVGSGGRVFLVGSGSSGRVAIDIAAKCNLNFPEVKNQIVGVIAGGDSAFIRAKEGFEDSETDGMKALQTYNLGPKDCVILISASGSATFNVGCGHYAAEKGANVLYFYNSKSIPSRTQKLFDRRKNPVIPLCVDIGPQAIAGSTRLQGASLAQAGLGALLASALHLNRGERDLAKQYPQELALKMREGIALIRKNIPNIAQFVVQENAVFSDPGSNFRQVRDFTDSGYVTFITAEDCIREVLIDSTETSPTFSTNPIQRENETGKKRAEFQAYLVGKKDNQDAWQALLGREAVKDTEAFLLSHDAEGVHSYQKRPVGKGNFLIGVAKLNESEQIPKDLIQLLEKSRQRGCKTGLLLICKGQIKEVVQDAMCVIENVPSDSMGLVESIILKQTLNLISNGSMVLMNKVYGNLMIDVRASNNKLIDRCMRLIKEIYQQDFTLTNKQLYHAVAHVSAMKKRDEEQGIYTPSVVKIVLAMLALKKTPENFQEVVSFLNEKQERIDGMNSLLAESGFILCIDGGGSKTILQLLDSKGKLVAMRKDNTESDRIMAAGSNINTIGKEGVKAVLQSLFEDVHVGSTKLVSLLPDCQVVAGMAGAALPKNKQSLVELFEEYGIQRECISVMSDAELALQLIDDSGMILISGTGSICLGKKKNTLYRVGGLGKVLGDEGSGYQIGLQALKAALAEEYGWGTSTRLTLILKEFFNVNELKNLIPQINSGGLQASKIAAAAPFVFEAASQGDRVAEGIIASAANDLGQLLATQLKISGLSDCEVHLWGGIFKSLHADGFIQKIRNVVNKNLKIINKSSENVAVLYASKYILKK